MITITHDNPKVLKENFQKRMELIRQSSTEYYLHLHGDPIIFLRVRFLVRVERAIEEFLGNTAGQITFSLGSFRGKESAEKLIGIIGKEEFSSLSLEEKLKYALNMLFLNGAGSFTIELSEDFSTLILKTNKDNEAVYTEGRLVNYVLGYATGFLSTFLEKELNIGNIREIDNLIVIYYNVSEKTF